MKAILKYVIASSVLSLCLSIYVNAQNTNMDKNINTITNDTWKGNLQVASNNITFFLKFNIYKDNIIQSFLSVPEQGLNNYRADSLVIDGLQFKSFFNKLNIVVTGIYAGDTIPGTFVQNGYTFPILLTKSDIPVLNRPQTPLPPFPYISQDVVFENKAQNLQLAGTLTLPRKKGPFKAVIMISGSGYQDRNEEMYEHKPFMVIADYLTRHGIAVLRYDDRGMGKSGGSMIGNTTADLSTDAYAAYKYLSGRDDISEVGLCGHSEGGEIAYMLAAKYSEIPFIISMAGPTVMGRDILLSQQKALSLASGTPEQYISQAQGVNQVLYNIIVRSSEVNDSLKNAMRESLSKQTKGSVDNKQIESVVNELTNPWMYYFMKYSPREDILNIHIPVLALNGEKDLQVLPDLNLNELDTLSKLSGNIDNVTIKRFPDLNHLFQHCSNGLPSEYAKIEETISLKVLEEMVIWINSLD
ncbi:MAG: alpha/beta hydrolase [Bacteroidales bacterium]